MVIMFCPDPVDRLLSRRWGPLAGTVIRTGNQGDGLRYVDVRLNSSIDGVAYNVRYKDLLGVGVGVGTRLSAGSNIGTVRPAGDPRSEIGLHVTLVLRSEYSGYVDRVRNGQYSPMGIFRGVVNDLRSRFRCRKPTSKKIHSMPTALFGKTGLSLFFGVSPGQGGNK